MGLFVSKIFGSASQIYTNPYQTDYSTGGIESYFVKGANEVVGTPLVADVSHQLEEKATTDVFTHNCKKRANEQLIALVSGYNYKNEA